MKQEPLDIVVEFIKTHWPVEEPEKLNRKTSLFFELDIDGENAELLLEQFVKEFNIDFEEFNFSAYFNAGPNLSWKGILDLMIDKPEPGKKIFTIANLEQAIITGKLI